MSSAPNTPNETPELPRRRSNRSPASPACTNEQTARADEIPARPKRERHRGRVSRFFRGYLMIIGSLTTVYALVRLVLWLLVEMAKWMPAA